MEGLLTRRSVRKFEDKPVPKEILEQLVKAGEYAPSAHNTRPWEFLVLQNKDILKHFRVVQRSALFAENAAAVIWFAAVKTFPSAVKKKAGAILISTVPPPPKILFWRLMPWDLEPAGAVRRR